MKMKRIWICVVGLTIGLFIMPIPVESTITQSNPTYSGTTNGQNLGYALERIDSDGDSIWEIAIMQKNKVFVYEYNSSQQTFDSSDLTNITITGGLELDDMAVGDFNGDGYQDLIVSDYDADYLGPPRTNNCGKISIYLGSENNGLIHDDDLHGPVTVSSTDPDFGYSMDAGDFDGDGFSDLLISAKGVINPLTGDIGEVYIYWGFYATSGMTGSDVNKNWRDMLLLTGSVSSYNTISPTVNFNDIGWCARNIGDVNDDDYDDIEISGNFSEYGRYFNMGIIYGDEKGYVSNTPDDLLQTDYVNHWTGADVDNGDINGDGYSDMITGFLFDVSKKSLNDKEGSFILNNPDDYDPSCSLITGVLIFLGNQNGLSWSNSHYFIAPFSGAWEFPPYDITSFGDEDDDGYDEIILSRPTAENYYGTVYCWSGSGSLSNGTYDSWDISGTQSDQQFGYARPYSGKALCGMPDTDDDDIDEAFIGSPYWDGPSVTDSGKVEYYK